MGTNMYTIQVKEHSNTPSTTQTEMECGEYMHQQDGMRDVM